MAHDRVNVVADDFCFEEGMTKNQIESEINIVKTVQELTYDGQDIVSIPPVVSNVFGYISSDWIDGVSSINGIATGNQDETNIGFEINTDNPEGLSITVGSYTGPYIFNKVGGSGFYTKEALNTNLLRTSYSVNDYTQLKPASIEYRINYQWDMNKNRTVSFKFRILGSNTSDTFEFSGSDDNINWTSIYIGTNADFDLDKTINSITGYRYYKFTYFPVTNTQSLTIYYMYLGNVEDSITKKKNKFTLDSTIVNNQKLTVKTPTGFNVTNVAQNTLNDILIDKILNPDDFYNLLYNTTLEVNPFSIDKLILDMTLTEDVTSIDISRLLESNGIYAISIVGNLSTAGVLNLYGSGINLGSRIAYLDTVSNLCSGAIIFINNNVIATYCNQLANNQVYCWQGSATVNLDNLSIKNYSGYTIKSGTNIQIRRLD